MSTPPKSPRDPSPRAPDTPAAAAPSDTCDVCGSASVEWRNCKLICLNCRAIVKSCSDL